VSNIGLGFGRGRNLAIALRQKSPMNKKAYVENFVDKLRDEFLDRELFQSPGSFSTSGGWTKLIEGCINTDGRRRL
jgi:hypothetical protein